MIRLRKSGSPLRIVLALLLLGAWGQVKAEAVSGATYTALTDIQELITDDQEEQAYRDLKELSGVVEEDTIDEAIVLQMLGRMEAGRGEYPAAIDAFRKSYDSGLLPERMQVEVGRTLAQLLSSEGRYPEALEVALEWFATVEEPGTREFIFMANLYAQTEQFERTIEFVDNAIDVSDSPRESWFQLMISASFQIEDYPRAAEDLKRALQYWPGQSDYWVQLANIHVELNQEDKALAVLQLAWKSNVLTRENAIRSMIQLAVHRGIPEKGARLLATAMDRDLVPRDEYYVRLLANAWINAREYSDGFSELEELAEITGSGDPLVRVGNLQIDQGDWDEAIESLRRAQEKGTDDPGRVWTLLGIALTEQSRFGEGMDALRKASAYDDAAPRARRWLEYAEQLKRQHNWKSRNQS